MPDFRREYCSSHVHPDRWKRTPVADRYGWEEARCIDCGTFIGFNPIRTAKEVAAEQSAKAENHLFGEGGLDV